MANLKTSPSSRHLQKKKQCKLKTEILFWMGRKDCGKGENAGYQASFSGLFEVRIVWLRFNSVPNDKILEWSKLKAFADRRTTKY